MGRIVLGENNDDLEVRPGGAAYVACGAYLPRGADAVVKLEEVRVVDGMVGISRPLEAGENVDEVGQDLRRGGLVMRSWSTLRPQDIAMLVSLAEKSVRTVRKPRVAIIPVGTELTRLARGPDRAIEKNSLIISGFLRELYADPRRLDGVEDDVGKIASAVARAAKDYDFVITMGGCSVGVKDLVPEAVNSLGSPGLIAHGISVFPGKATGLAVVGGKPVILLPGRVTSAVAGFFLCAVPVLGRIVGFDPMARLPRLRARAKNGIRGKGGAHRFEILKVTRLGSRYFAESLPKGVDILSSLVRANGYVLVQPHVEVQEGQEVEVQLFSSMETSMVNQ